MQKAGIILVTSGILIVAGLILVVLGNQIILEGVNQGNEGVSISQNLLVSNKFNPQETTSGVFAVQIMDFKENIFTVRVIDPNGNEIISEIINEDSFERKFDTTHNGDYQLLVESTSAETIQVFGAIGPVPDAGKKSLGFISIYIVIVGMIGLVLAGIYSIKNRKKSI